MSTNEYTLDEALQIAMNHHRAGRVAQAEAIYRTILQHQTQHARTLFLLGSLCYQKGEHDEAESLIKQAIKVNPNDSAYYYNLGMVFLAKHQTEDAEQAFLKTISLDPRDASALNNLATVQRNLGLYDAARKNYEQALQIQPDFQHARSNLLFLLSYNVLCGPQEMLEAHIAWDRIHGGPVKAATFTHPRRGNPGKRLRIGYVSPDFRKHAISYFFEPILQNHDASQVEIFCYAEVKNPDDVTQRLQQYAHHWHSSVGMDDRALAERIHKDQIDVLIDLNGHTSPANSRLGVFTYKPAPVQATYLGYFTTTGLAAMDYWITDNILHPPHTIELSTEKLLRLPRCCLAYSPPTNAPLPCREQTEEIVFASFNHLSKISSAAIELWSQVLHAVPASRLMIKTTALADSQAKTMIQERFSAYGISPQQLILSPYTTSYSEHLSQYGKIDIILDTVPRTGGTMTAEALWMGAPVITLAGERFIERLSTSMLEAIDLPELIAQNPSEYIAKSVALARDHAHRRQLRASLRTRMAQSPLCDGRGLAQALESAYRDMWVYFLNSASAT